MTAQHWYFSSLDKLNLVQGSHMVAAYSKLAVDEVFFVIWLIKIRKRSGLNTVPHGMPDVTSDLEECFPSSTKYFLFLIC